MLGVLLAPTRDPAVIERIDRWVSAFSMRRWLGDGAIWRALVRACARAGRALPNLDRIAAGRYSAEGITLGAVLGELDLAREHLVASAPVAVFGTSSPPALVLPEGNEQALGPHRASLVDGVVWIESAGDPGRRRTLHALVVNGTHVHAVVDDDESLDLGPTVGLFVPLEGLAVRVVPAIDAYEPALAGLESAVDTAVARHAALRVHEPA